MDPHDDCPRDDSDDINWWLDGHYERIDDEAAESEDVTPWEWRWVDWDFLLSVWVRAMGATHNREWEPIHQEAMTKEHALELQRLADANLCTLNREVLWFNRFATEAVNGFAARQGLTPDLVFQVLAYRLGVELILEDDGDTI
jgi:hypothetical protein